MTEEEREKAKQLAIDAIRKKHGKQALILSADDFPEIDWISTTSLGLDKALGGGIPKGRVIELYGPESGGKTTLALHIVATCQKNGGLAAFIDAEHALDPEYATNLGVDIDKLTISQPDNGEQALDIVDTLVRSQAYELIVVDSVAALVPQAELEGNMGDSHMGLQARLMSQACRKLTGIVKTANTAVVFINQIRMKIGVMFGNPETVSGGNALRFYTSQRIDIRRIGSVKEGDQVVANRTRAKVIKNKVAPPARQAEFNIVFGRGIDSETELIDMGTDAKIIHKNGAWYSYNDQNIGQGKIKAAQALRDNPELKEEIAQKVKEAL